jgi:hypothetical protein
MEVAMKVKVERDRRSDVDKAFDKIYNKMVHDAKLTPRQENIVSAYMKKIMLMRMHEIESIVDMSWMIHMIEDEGWGTDPSKGATRLLRSQTGAAAIREEAYGHECTDAHGFWNSYDGCGLEHLQTRLKRYGCEYNTRIEEDT